MRIHLPLHPHHFTPQSTAGPLARIGGDLVVIELQGHLEWEGDKADGVVGVLGLDRPVSVSGAEEPCGECRAWTLASFRGMIVLPMPHPHHPQAPTPS
jgi:hypothetical protein